MTNINKCEQQKCAFLNTRYCPQCISCGCPPNYIDEDCVNCWNCLKDENFIRKGKSDSTEITEEVEVYENVNN
jgi:hypothetical protein